MVKILVVDDEIECGQEMALLIQSMGHKVLTANSVGEAKKLISKHKDLGLVVSEFCMMDGNGLEIIGYAKKTYPSIKTAIYTSINFDSIPVVRLDLLLRKGRDEKIIQESISKLIKV
jgi:DNA-binding NtrC family response regulator